MSRDLYQGTGDAAMEARIKAIWDALNRLQASTNVSVTSVLNQTNVTTDGLATYKDTVAAQFASERSISDGKYALIADSFLVPSVLNADLVVPSGFQMLVFKNLEIAAGVDLDAEGEVVVL